MRWSVDDQMRFASDLLAFLKANVDNDDVIERLIGMIEDQLLIAGVGVREHGVLIAVYTIVPGLDSERWKRWADRLPISRGAILAGLLAAFTGAIINRDDERCRTRRKRRRRHKP